MEIATSGGDCRGDFKNGQMQLLKLEVDQDQTLAKSTMDREKLQVVRAWNLSQLSGTMSRCIVPFNTRLQQHWFMVVKYPYGSSAQRHKPGLSTAFMLGAVHLPQVKELPA